MSNTVTNKFQTQYRIPEDYGHTASQEGSTNDINSLPSNALVEIVTRRSPFDSDREFVTVDALRNGARVVGTVSDGGSYSQRSEVIRTVNVWPRQLSVQY